MESALFWLVLAGLQGLPVVLCAVLARWMHRSVALIVAVVALGLLVVTDAWTYRHLADDALTGLAFVLVPAYIAAGVLVLGLVDILVRRLGGVRGATRR